MTTTEQITIENLQQENATLKAELEQANKETQRHLNDWAEKYRECENLRNKVKSMMILLADIAKVEISDK